MNAITVGSQCAGYGGLEMALQQHLPVEHAWYAEVDEAASKVLAHHYPGVPNLGDITAVDWAAVERPTIMTSGFPCQPMSSAGKRGGSSDERHLWPVGVLPAVAAMMPPLVILENVRGILTIENGQIFAEVLADLDDLGYTVSWTVVGACRVGACHHRHRVFIAATLIGARPPLSDPVAHRACGGWGPAQSVLFGDSVAVRWPMSGFTKAGAAWELPSEPCGLDGLSLPTPKASDTGTPGRRASAGWRPPLSEVLLNMFPTPRTSDTNGVGLHGTGGLDLRPAVSLLPTPRASDAEKGGPNQRGSSGDVMLPSAVQPERFGKYAAAVRRHELAYGLAAPDPTEPGRTGRPRLSAEFPEFMQGLSPGHLTDVVDRKDAVKLAGNGVNVRQGAYGMGLLPTFRAAVAELHQSEQVAA